MIRIGRNVALLAVALSMAAVSLPALTGRVMAAGKTGIVLMHGKGGTCERSTLCGELRDALSDKGYLVAAPVMPWGKGRIYDRDHAGAMSEIDALVADLKAKGADRVVVGGHSMGANAALSYGLDHPDIAGIIALAAGHQPENPFLQRQGLSDAVAKAKEMIDAGKGDEMGAFIDFNVRPQPPARTTANIYYSWFAPDGPANMMRMAQRYTGQPPVLWLDSETEQNPKMAMRRKLAQLMQEKPNVTYAVLAADHLHAPPASIPAVLAWLETKLDGISAPVATPSAPTPAATATTTDEPVGPKGYTPSQVIANSDKDGDGKLSPSEFKGPPTAFKRIDKDGDGFLIKQELIDAWR